MEKRRVVITGMGVVSPIGNTVSELWDNIKNNVSGITEISLFDTSNFKVKLAGEVKNLNMEEYFTKRELSHNSKFTKFARITAKQAMENAAFDLNNLDHTKMGVIIGSGIGGIESIENSQDKLRERGPSRVSPFFIPTAIVNMAAGEVAIDNKAYGTCYGVVTACASANNAIGEAFHKIVYGYEDVIITGGSEASVTPLAVAGFANMRALHEGSDPKRASIPFNKDRSGFVIAEGSATLILEELEHAKKRGAVIYAELIGYGSSCDAFHITAPSEDGSGGALAMQRALEDANISPETIDYVNAHGTSTPLNDKIETMAVKTCFKDHAYKLAMSSTKSYTGHLLGASGGLEAIVTIMGLKNGYIPPTINYMNKDEDCDLDIVPNVGREQVFQYAMSNSLGFGGHNASLIFKRWEN